jgi:hypothetical protein
MRLCIYCKSPNTEPSAEHVIADGLGGSIELPASDVCKSCNNALNERVDRPIQRDMLPILAQLNIPGKRGDIPNWEVTETIDGDARRLRIDQTSVTPAETRKLLSKTGDTYEFRVTSMEELQRARDEIANRFPDKRVELTIQGPISANLPDGRIDYVDFTQPYWTQWAAKTALNCVSFVLGPDAALMPELDDLRLHVLGTAVCPPGLSVGGSGPNDVEVVEDLSPEHSILLSVQDGVLRVHVTMFHFCGLRLERPTGRTIDVHRAITLDASRKRIASDSA